MSQNIIFKAHFSQQDQSVNFEYPAPNVGRYENRYVRRVPEYIIGYLSSQSGCDQACRFCHLTSTGQNQFDNAEMDDLMQQAERILEHYDTQAPAKLIHWNFMARGEPLNNPLLLSDSAQLLNGLAAKSQAHGLESKFLVSSIFPTSMGDLKLEDIFPEVHPEIYYSIYSMNPSFRKRWLARAHTAEHGLDMLKAWQDFSHKVPKIHFAFIEGENDSEADMVAIANAINERDLKVNLNIVRYNPYSAKYGQEPSEEIIQRNTEILRSLIKAESWRIVPKVGFDVKASCGMFLKD